MNSCEAIIINISAHPGTDAACCRSAGVDLSLLQPPPTAAAAPPQGDFKAGAQPVSVRRPGMRSRRRHAELQITPTETSSQTRNRAAPPPR